MCLNPLNGSFKGFFIFVIAFYAEKRIIDVHTSR